LPDQAEEENSLIPFRMMQIGMMPINGGGQVPDLSPAVRRKRLGLELRRLREQAGLSCEDVGSQLDCSGTRVSRIETGRISIRPGDVREMLDIYEVTGGDVAALIQLAREARRKPWWHAYGRIVPSWLETYIGLETEAARLRDFQPLVVPGLLQTGDYARVTLTEAPDVGHGEAIERQVALRLDRQAILGRPDPPDLWVVLSENALRVQAGGAGVMRAQLRRLADLARRPNITLQILPGRHAAHVYPVGAFTILDVPEAADPTVVYVEHLTGGLFLESGDEVWRYGAVFDDLRSQALGTAESADLIGRLAAAAR
jgi:transcriptional regulator with XRE-family HTH domain